MHNFLFHYHWALVLEACDCLKLLSIYFNLCVDATGGVCHQLDFLGTDLHAVAYQVKGLRFSLYIMLVSWCFQPSQLVHHVKRLWLNITKKSYYIIYFTAYHENDSNWPPNKFLNSLLTYCLFIPNWFYFLHQLATWIICIFTLGLQYARLKTFFFCTYGPKGQGRYNFEHACYKMF